MVVVRVVYELGGEEKTGEKRVSVVIEPLRDVCMDVDNSSKKLRGDKSFNCCLIYYLKLLRYLIETFF
jgi:hypothetical protein